MQCMSCFIGDMVSPIDRHPSYIVCDNCGAIELTYRPAQYQQGLHQVKYHRTPRGEIDTQIIGIFGG